MIMQQCAMIRWSSFAHATAVMATARAFIIGYIFPCAVEQPTL